MRAVGLALVVELLQASEEHLRFGAVAEPFSVRQFAMQLAVDALEESVLPRGGEGWLDCSVSRPAHDPGSDISAPLSDRTKVSLRTAAPVATASG